MLSYYQASNRNYSINFSSQEEAAAAIEKYKSEIMEEGDTIPEGGETVTYTLQPQAAMTVIDQKTGAVVALVGGTGRQDRKQDLKQSHRHYQTARIHFQDSRGLRSGSGRGRG